MRVESGDPLLMLHWNVHSWRDASGQPNLDAVVDLVNETDPDVISLVEVSEPWAAPIRLPELARRTGYAWMFVPSVEPGTDRPARGYGNALLTRLPVLAFQQWQLTWPPRVYDGTEPSESRSVALARLALPSATVEPGAPTAVWAGSTHLPSNDPRERAAALSRLASLARGLDGPWVVCGDFNAAPAEWIEPGAPIVVGPDPPQPTFPASDPSRPIDYCIASPGVALDASPVWVAGSDHLPVLARCRPRPG
jgi:endonuclease/exonuclease/phosphatase family metal-dependent hydrolase